MLVVLGVLVCIMTELMLAMPTAINYLYYMHIYQQLITVYGSSNPVLSAHILAFMKCCIKRSKFIAIVKRVIFTRANFVKR